MARILTDETSLTRKRRFLGRETRALRILAIVEGVAGVIFLTMGVLLPRSGWWWALGAACAFLAVGHALKVRHNENEQRAVAAGLKGEHEVTRLLKTGLDNNCYILNDVTIRRGWKRAQMDHLVVTPHGIFVIETKNWRGRISGDGEATYWIQEREPGKPRIRLRNPVTQNRRQAEILRMFLKDHGIEWEDIFPLLVCRSPQTVFEIRNAVMPVLKPAEAVEYIAGMRLDRPYSEEQVTAVINLLMKAT